MVDKEKRNYKKRNYGTAKKLRKEFTMDFKV